jgi:hypothetical protein
MSDLPYDEEEDWGDGSSDVSDGAPPHSAEPRLPPQSKRGLRGPSVAPPTSMRSPLPDIGPIHCVVNGDVSIDKVKVEKLETFRGERFEYIEVTDAGTVVEVIEATLRGHTPSGYKVTCRECKSFITPPGGTNIAVLGEAEAGKSHVVFGWLRQCSTGRGGIRGDLRSVHADTSRRIRAKIAHVFEDHQTLSSNVWAMPEDQMPIQQKFNLPKFSDRVTIHDFAGEYGLGQDLAEAYAPFLRWADYYVFCLEPRAFPEVAQSLGDPTRADRLQPVEMIYNFADIYRRANEIEDVGTMEPVKLPVALVITKGDELKDHYKDDPEISIVVDQELRRFKDPSSYGTVETWFENLKDHSEAVADLLRALSPVGAGVVRAIEESFTSVSFHLTSALGSPAVDTAHEDSASDAEGEVINRKEWQVTEMTLSGVVEPFARALWIKKDNDPFA